MSETPDPPNDSTQPATPPNNAFDSEPTDTSPSCSKPGKPRSLGVVISWLLIIAAVVASQIPQTGQTPTAPSHAVAPDVAMQLTGRYAIGMKSIFGNALVADRTLPQLKQTLEDSDNPRKHIFFAPLLMELGQDEAALKELERLAENSTDKSIARDAKLFLKLYRQGSRSLDPGEQRAVEQFGWLGRLALSYDKSNSDPMRVDVIQSAMRTFIVSIIFIVALLGAFTAGLILFIVAIVLWRKKRLNLRIALPDSPGNSLLEAFALFIVGLVALPTLGRWLSPSLEATATLLTLPIVVLALFWPSIRGTKFNRTRMAIGWHRGQGVFREMGAGIVGYLAGLPLLALALIPVLLLSRSTGTVPSHPIVNEISRDPVSLIIIIGLACLWAPVVEETFFRGTLYGYLRRRWHWSIAGIGTGFLFAVLHPQGWIAVPLLGTIGFILSTIREWRSSIIASMTAHAMNNGTVLILTIFMLT